MNKFKSGEELEMVITEMIINYLYNSHIINKATYEKIKKHNKEET